MPALGVYQSGPADKRRQALILLGRLVACVVNKEDASNYQPPFSASVCCFRGRPRGRIVDCKPKRCTTACTHPSEPYGRPRATDWRMASQGGVSPALRSEERRVGKERR